MSISVEDWDDIAEAPREEPRRLGRRRAAKQQAVAEKAQPAPEQAPAAQKPPRAPEPAPAAEQPVPAPAPAPVAKQPAPAPAPAPVAEEPAPAAAPVPVPVPKKRAPASTPAPVAENPAPAPRPVAKKPAPAPALAPVPVVEEPASTLAPAPAPEAKQPALAAEKPAPEPERAAQAPAPAPAKPKREQRAPATKPAALAPAPAPEVAPAPAVIAPASDLLHAEPAFDLLDAAPAFDDFDDFDRLNGVSDPPDEVSDELSAMPLRRRLQGRTPDAAPAAETWAAYAPETDPAEPVVATAEPQEVAASVDDWNELGDAPRRISIRGLTRAVSSDSAAPAERDEAKEVDFGTAPGESLRLPLGLAAANILIWLLARFSGVVELIGISFAASVGMLLAAYVLREWQKDRSALIYLVGALPLPITIFALIA